MDEELGEKVMTKETCIAFFENCARDTPNNKSIL
jgi:hypothetical protein